METEVVLQYLERYKNSGRSNRYKIRRNIKEAIAEQIAAGPKLSKTEPIVLQSEDRNAIIESFDLERLDSSQHKALRITYRDSLSAFSLGAADDISETQRNVIVATFENYFNSQSNNLRVGAFRELLPPNVATKVVELDPLSFVELEGASIDRLRLREELEFAANYDGKAELGHILPAPISEELQIIVMRGFWVKRLLGQLFEAFRISQEKENYLINTGTGEKSFTNLSVLPVVLSKGQERELTEMVEDLGLAKTAIVESAKENTDLRNFLLDGVSETMKEVMEASMFDIPKHVRLRFDTFCSSAPGHLKQIELNGNEPQGDVGNSANIQLMKDFISQILQKCGASQEEIDYCFEGLKLPVYQVGDMITSVYREKQQDIMELPHECNVGFFAWKDVPEGPEDSRDRKPLSPISNLEADQSGPYFKRIPGIKEAISFDPFDISPKTPFREIITKEGPILIPLVRRLSDHGEEELVEIHFIRRLGGGLSKDKVWEALRHKRPQVYYPLIGKVHPDWNPEGKKVPNWMWMNPLSSLLTDKKLDAILSDCALLERFQVRRALEERMRKDNPDLSIEKIGEDIERILQACQLKYIPKTRMLCSSRGGGLYQGDEDPVGTLSEEEIEHIKKNRRGFVLKLHSLTGFSGHGVVLGRQFAFEDIPTRVLRSFSEEGLERLFKFLDDYALPLIDESRNELKKAKSGRRPKQKQQSEEPDKDSEQRRKYLKEKKKREDRFRKAENEFREVLLALKARTEESKEQYPRLKTCLKRYTAALESSMCMEHDKNALDELRDLFWEELIKFGIKEGQAIIQTEVSAHNFPVIEMCYKGEHGVELKPKELYTIDINPQAFGRTLSLLHSRGSRDKSGKTNVTSSHGCRRVVFSYETAERIVSLFSTLEAEGKVDRLFDDEDTEEAVEIIDEGASNQARL